MIGIKKGAPYDAPSLPTVGAVRWYDLIFIGSVIPIACPSLNCLTKTRPLNI
jgi:hypothetical protein